MRQHMRKEKSLSIRTCTLCPYETRFKHNLNRHTAKAHTAKEKEPKATKACPECGKPFQTQKKLTRHKKIHQTKDSPTSPKVVQKVKSNIGFGTFVSTEKESTTQEFLCAQCSKICRDSHNLERHMRQVHLKKQKKKKKNRTTVMRKVKQMLSDEDFLREMNRQRNINAPSATIDETLIETIMANIPMISNRNIVKTLSILRKRLPKEMFKSNLRKAIAKRTNLLEDLFESVFTDVVDGEGETINMPVTYAKHLPTLIHLICEKRNYSEDDIKLCLGVDGGQSKLIATLAVIPKNEKNKCERMSEKLWKDRSKSTSTKRCFLVGRIDSVPENRTNVKVLIDHLNLPELRRDFCIIADIKLIDLMVGIQSTSSIHSCPYCTGNKVDKSGKPTNQKGTWVKGETRTGRNLVESYEAYTQSGSKRKNLKNFNSVEHMPLHIHENQQNLSVIELYPPPQLHCGILGPANDVLAKLDELFPADMAAYRALFHIKGGGPGGDLNGPTLKAILENTNGRLDRLSQIVSQYDPKYYLFINHLDNLKRLNRAVNMKILDKGLIANIIEDLGNVFQKLQDQFDMSMPLKLHIILSHYMEFFEMKNETLLSYTDEFTESMHAAIRQFERVHAYENNKKGTESHKDDQHKCVVHINSINLGDA